MASVGFGGFAARSGHTAGGVYSSATLPHSPYRTAENGDYIAVTSLYGAIGGRGAARSGTMYCGSAAVGVSTGATSQANDTGWLGTNWWVVAGGTGVNYGYTGIGGTDGMYFARSSTSGAIGCIGQFGNFTGYVGMNVNYGYVPSAASIASVTPSSDGTSAVVVVNNPGDNGGFSISNRRIQYSADGFATVIATLSSSGTTTITGLTPGQTYSYRANGSNWLTDSLGSLGGAWSAVRTATQTDPAGVGRIAAGSGDAFIAADGKRWNSGSSAWDALAGKRYDSTSGSWVDLGH